MLIVSVSQISVSQKSVSTYVKLKTDFAFKIYKTLTKLKVKLNCIEPRIEHTLSYEIYHCDICHIDMCHVAGYHFDLLIYLSVFNCHL